MSDLSDRSIGLDLLAARNAAGLSLEQVAEKTKLRSSLVAALERNDFSLCGGDVYARGHIRVLANLYRIDSTYLLELFDKEFGVAETALDDLAQATSLNLDRRITVSWKSLSGVAAVGLLAAVVVSNQLTSAPENITAPQSNSERASTSASPNQSESLPAVASVDEGVTVRLTVVKSYSWISVTAADGSSLFTGQIEKGEVREFTDPQVLRLVIGNAGAVSINENGADRGIAGDIGEVVRLEFTPDAENSQG
ncbi:MAG: helix-turn-helix domain-containing protein [Actinomycetota bacterium]